MRDGGLVWGEPSAPAGGAAVGAHALVRVASSSADAAAEARAGRVGTAKWYTIFGVSQAEPVREPLGRPFESEAERVAQTLRDQIIDGTRAPGDRLVERDLAAELAVSRIPIRDALKTLVAEGLVTPRPRTWAVVRTFTADDIEDLIEVRSALETLAFRLAAERGTADQLALLGEQLAGEQLAAATGNARVARRAGADFHETVVAMAHNTLLTELFTSTRSRMRWLLGQHTELTLTADEHAGLYRALVDRDRDRAGRLAEQHLTTSRRAALRTYGPGIES